MDDMIGTGLPKSRAERRLADIAGRRSGWRPVKRWLGVHISRTKLVSLGLGAFVTALAMLAGFVTGAVHSNLPGMPSTLAAASTATPPNLTGITIGVVNGQAETTEAQVEQILGLLERAEATALNSDVQVKLAISSAAGELGTLLTAYLHQQPTELIDWLPFTVAPDEIEYPLAPVRLAEPTESTIDAVESSGATEVDPDDSQTQPPVFEPLPDEPGLLDHNLTRQWLQVGALSYETPEVTFDEIIVAALHLAELMDRVGVTVILEEQLVEEDLSEALSITEMLLAAVERWGNSTDNYFNGRLPDHVLCPLPFAPTHRLRCDAATMLIALNEAFVAEFGRILPIGDTYRTYESQVVLRARVGRMAAVPGTSMHGWGLAVDFGQPIRSGDSAEYIWLRVNAPNFGWDNPEWARPDGIMPEPWHFEFFAAGPIPNRALTPDDVVTTGDVDGASTNGYSDESTYPLPPGDAENTQGD